MFMSGSDDGLFLDFRGRQMLETMSVEPENLLRSYRVAFQSTDRNFNPIAAKNPSHKDAKLNRSNLGGAEQPPVYTALLLTEGIAKLDPEGCTDLILETQPWQCAMTRACIPARSFLTVTDVGCGQPRTILTLPYSGGVATGVTPDVEVRAQVETRARGIQTDILRTRIAFRYSK
jgi:hypothetical protein